MWFDCFEMVKFKVYFKIGYILYYVIYTTYVSYEYIIVILFGV